MYYNKYDFVQKIQREEDENEFSEDSVMDEQKKPRDYWESVMYVGITAFTTLLFSLGYYYIEVHVFLFNIITCK